MTDQQEATRVEPLIGLPTILPGTVLSNTYQVEGRLGGGGLGDVYQARHLALPREPLVAIKVIRPDLAADRLLAALIAQEAAILRSIHNDAVVGYEGAFLDEHGRRFLVMEFIAGPSLAERLRGHPLSVDEVHRLKRRLAAALAEVHEQKVYHRDLSPDNILLRNGDLDRATLVDFGIAKRDDPERGTIIGRGFAGKYLYASPEQFGLYGGKVDGRSDIYSLGLVLAAAAAGKPLPMGGSEAAAVEARKRVPDLSSVPGVLRPELAVMLQPEPNRRPRSMQELCRPAAPAEMKPALARWRTSHSMRRLRWPAIGVLSIAAAVAWLIVVAMPKPPPVDPAALQGVLAGFECAEGLDFSVPRSGTVAVFGVLDKPGDRGLLQAQVAQVRGVQQIDLAGVEVREKPVCEVIDSEGLRHLLASAECSGMEYRLAGEDGVALQGWVGRPDDLARIDAAVQQIKGVRHVDVSAVRSIGNAFCPVLNAVGRWLPGLSGSPQIALDREEPVFRAGERFTARVRMPADRSGFLYVDYFDEGGNVLHLWPNPLGTNAPGDGNRHDPGAEIRLGVERGQERRGVRHYEIGPPFGRSFLVALVSEQPLFDSKRPETEKATDYLKELERRLDTAADAAPPAGGAVSFQTRPRA